MWEAEKNAFALLMPGEGASEALASMDIEEVYLYFCKEHRCLAHARVLACIRDGEPLDLRGCGLGDDGTLAFAAFLHAVRTREAFDPGKTVDYRSNGMSCVSFCALAAAVVEYDTIKELHVGHNMLRKDSLEVIFDLLTKRPSLRLPGFRENPIDSPSSPLAKASDRVEQVVSTASLPSWPPSTPSLYRFGLKEGESGEEVAVGTEVERKVNSAYRRARVDYRPVIDELRPMFPSLRLGAVVAAVESCDGDLDASRSMLLEMDHAFAEEGLSPSSAAVLVPVLEMSQAMSPSDAAGKGQRAKNRNHDEHESEDTHLDLQWESVVQENTTMDDVTTAVEVEVKDGLKSSQRNGLLAAETKAEVFSFADGKYHAESPSWL
eukprot:g3799.t1